MRTKDVLMLALDGLNFAQAMPIVMALRDKIWGVKIHDMWDHEGPRCVRWFHHQGIERVFVDLKLHDIPLTVKRRASEVKNAGGSFVSVHAIGGSDMLSAAVETGISVIGITLLTSISDEAVRRDFGTSPEIEVEKLARTAWVAGVHGITCPAHELANVLHHRAQRPEWEEKPVFVPGLRSAGKEEHDQVRVHTPGFAIRNGANYLVIGRQIVEAQDPAAELSRIEEEIGEALREDEMQRQETLERALYLAGRTPSRRIG